MISLEGVTWLIKEHPLLGSPVYTRGWFSLPPQWNSLVTHCPFFPFSNTAQSLGNPFRDESEVTALIHPMDKIGMKITENGNPLQKALMPCPPALLQLQVRGTEVHTAHPTPKMGLAALEGVVTVQLARVVAAELAVMTLTHYAVMVAPLSPLKNMYNGTGFSGWQFLRLCLRVSCVSPPPLCWTLTQSCLCWLNQHRLVINLS